MPNNSNSVVYIDYTSEFKRNLRTLAKKYRHIRSDIQPLINQLQTGTLLGNQIKGSSYTLFKSRARNSDIKKGKSSGYRLIYWQKSSHHLILVTIYSKLDQSDISPQQIQWIIKHFSQALQDAVTV